MDMNKALEEWNLVQATLRQCSGAWFSFIFIEEKRRKEVFCL